MSAPVLPSRDASDGPSPAVSAALPAIPPATAVDEPAAAAHEPATADLDRSGAPHAGLSLPPPRGRLRTAAARHFGGLPGPFWVVFAGTVISRVGTMVVPFLAFYLGSRGITPGQTPYVLGALGAGGLVGPVAGGWFADRFGRRQAILAGMVATPASQALLFCSPGPVTLSLAAALVGAAGSLHAPGVAAVIVDSAGPARRQAAFGLYHWAINLGAATAGAVGGFLVDRGFWLLFVVDAVTCLGFAVVAAVALPRTAPAARVKGAPGGGGYGVVVRDRLLLAFVTVSVAGECVYAQTEFTVPLAIRDHGLPATVYGLVAVVNAALVVVLQPVTNAWVLRFDRMRVWAAASVLVAAGVGLTGTARTTGGYVLTVLVWSAGEVCAGGIATSVVADLAPDDARARYQAALNWARGVARFLALGVGPALYAAAGPGTLWWSVTAVGLTGAAGALLIRPALARRTA
ncbi:MFS transporter [Actinacidiphila acidipaludis]|uniref:MFS transporter n=1 Tax=Actinacidiphila acidipaludis TaxID=2873382 RepID=A0ABS7Q626_9ACTN|nr:MFS transporter [Streptomyces acidipaludis]MBY8878608.1 MFS transporter [Streptomyces acidipaludis]